MISSLFLAFIATTALGKETGVGDPGYINEKQWDADFGAAMNPYRNLPSDKFQWLKETCINGYTTREASYDLWGSHTIQECRDQARVKEAENGSGVGTAYTYYNGQCFIFRNPKMKGGNYPRGKDKWLTCTLDKKNCYDIHAGYEGCRNKEESAEMEKRQKAAANFPLDRHQQECWTNGGCTKEGNQACDYCGLHNGKEQFCCKWAGKGACENVFGSKLNPKLPPGRSHVCAVSRDSRDMRVVDNYMKECWTDFGCRDSPKPCAACGYHDGKPMWCKRYSATGNHRCLPTSAEGAVGMKGAEEDCTTDNDCASGACRWSDRKCAPISGWFAKAENEEAVGDEYSAVMMANIPHSNDSNLLLYGFAAVGLGFLLYGAGKHFLGKSQQYDDLA